MGSDDGPGFVQSLKGFYCKQNSQELRQNEYSPVLLAMWAFSIHLELADVKWGFNVLQPLRNQFPNVGHVDIKKYTKYNFPASSKGCCLNPKKGCFSAPKISSIQHPLEDPSTYYTS